MLHLDTPQNLSKVILNGKLILSFDTIKIEIEEVMVKYCVDLENKNRKFPLPKTLPIRKIFMCDI